jgi:hypothetical protein
VVDSVQLGSITPKTAVAVALVVALVELLAALQLVALELPIKALQVVTDLLLVDCPLVEVAVVLGR